MKQNVAMARYLQRHIETGLPDAPADSIQTDTSRWHHVIVIPCYDESPALLANFADLASDQSTLIILILNRPESCPDAAINCALRTAIANLATVIQATATQAPVYGVTNSVELYCHDMERLNGPSPNTQGVGLARKVGCDIAIHWQNQGAISSQWICSTDADAVLPADYFSRLEQCDMSSSAAVFPFVHIAGESNEINAATALYELRLHHYVLGLAYAKSPYAYHTLGSCIAVKSDQYVQVRGYPKRSGGEDFYLLNKLAKISPISTLIGKCITLQSRPSQRVPFGTGPATQQIMEQGNGENTPVFYHPQSYEALRAVLAVIDDLRNFPLEALPSLLHEQGISTALCQATYSALKDLGLEAAIAHCQKQGRSGEQFRRQFDQWFDGFRTLKFIHAIRARGWDMQPIAALAHFTPTLFPDTNDTSPNKTLLRTNVLELWQWTTHSLEGAVEN
jgi:hypothetical protein